MPMMDEISNMNLNSIVYATNFSLGSQNAGLYASRLAGYFSAKPYSLQLGQALEGEEKRDSGSTRGLK